MTAVAEAWLPIEDRLAQWDPLAEQVRVTGWRPGPAGVSSIELTAGVWATVDHASPMTLTEVTIDADGGRIADGTLVIVANLLGPDAADVLRELPTIGSTTRPIPIRPPRRRDEFADPADVRDAQTSHVAFARLVLTADLGDDADLPDLARAATRLDGALHAVRFDGRIAGDLARRGVALLGRTPIGPRDAHHAAQLRQLLDVATQLGEVSDLDARRARQRLDDAEGHAADAMRRAAMPAAAAPVAAAAKAAPLQADVAESAALTYDSFERVEGEAEGVPLPVDGDHRGWAWLDRGSNVQLSAARTAAGAWARVFRADDRLLLGLAPMQPNDDGGCRSLVVVPPVVDPDRLVVDVVDHPTAPRRAPAHDLVRRAILTGRRAAHLSRLAHPGADAVWRDCAQQWSALGDPQRTNLALRHGRRDDRGRGRDRTSARLADVASAAVLADRFH